MIILEITAEAITDIFTPEVMNRCDTSVELVKGIPPNAKLVDIDFDSKEMTATYYFDDGESKVTHTDLAYIATAK
jgi:hypothetical protein